MIVDTVLLLALLSQGYWFLRAWGIAGQIKYPTLRRFLRGLSVVVFPLLLLAFFFNVSWRSNFVNWRSIRILALSGLWISSALLAFLAVQLVHGIAGLAGLATRVASHFRSGADSTAKPAPSLDSGAVSLPRRRFLQTSSALAGAAPFLAFGYGFAIERFQYQVRRVDLPIAGLPAALEGLHIAQLSDIHIGSYMSAAGVRRAVDMANELSANLTVVTGDFLTRRGDPLESCIAELSRLHAPLGVWGCNGNHEIYAGVEGEAERLFTRYGMVLLRQQSVELVHHGQPLNLIGVDYQRQASGKTRHPVMLGAIRPVVRRDMPNILLSHNPNSFPSAAELGIELMLTGHTHGGQVKVEILDHRFSPAQFLTPYVAGMYVRPLLSSSDLRDQDAWNLTPKAPSSVVYVNRGLGTIGAPVRLGVPPEISLLTLRRA